MIDRRLLPRDASLFTMRPSSPGIDRRTDSSGRVVVSPVPFFQGEVDMIATFRSDLEKIRSQQLPTVLMILNEHSFPEGNTFSRRGSAIHAMWETAERIERVTVLNDDYRSRYGYSMLGLQGTIPVVDSEGGTKEVLIPDRLRQMVEFVYATYGEPIDVDKFLSNRLFKIPLEDLRSGIPQDIVQRYTQMSVVEMLVYMRKAKELSSSEVARRVDWSQPQVSQLEHGKTFPDESRVARYLMAIGHIDPQQDHISPEARLAMLKARELQGLEACRRGRV